MHQLSDFEGFIMGNSFFIVCCVAFGRSSTFRESILGDFKNQKS